MSESTAQKETPYPSVVPFVDLPADKDLAFDFATYAELLASLILNAEPRSLTLGVFGGYGTGKTTLMRRVQRVLSPADAVTVWFDAWRYDHEENLLVPLLAALLKDKKIADSDDRKNAVKAALLGFLAGFSLKGPFFDFSPKDALAEARAARDRENAPLQRLTGGFVDIPDCLGLLSRKQDGPPRRIVIFVDDLDRCFPKKALAFLEAIKSLVDIPGFFFVMGLDPRCIGLLLKSKYEKDFVKPDEYLEKMIQIPFYLPKPSTQDVLKSLAVDIAHASMRADASNDRWFIEIPALLGSGSIGDYLPPNVRQSKRILNAHHSLRTLFRDTDAEFLLAVLILVTRWPAAYSLFYSSPIRATSVFRGQASTTDDALLHKDTDLTRDVADSECKKLVSLFILPFSETDHDRFTQHLAIVGWPLEVR